MISITLFTLNFFLGLLSAFSPCLFPMLPTYFAVTSRSKHPQRTQFISSLSLISGILIVFLLLSFSLRVFLGSFLIRNYVNFARIQAILIGIGGILLLTKPAFLTKLQVPDSINRRLLGDSDEVNPIYASFLMGLIFTIIAAPCAGGYFLAAWGTMIDQGIIGQIILVFAYSFGVGVPFIFIGLIAPEFNARLAGQIGNASEKISIAVGLVLIVTGIWLFTSVTLDFNFFAQ